MEDEDQYEKDMQPDKKDMSLVAHWYCLLVFSLLRIHTTTVFMRNISNVVGLFHYSVLSFLTVRVSILTI